MVLANLCPAPWLSFSRIGQSVNRVAEAACAIGYTTPNHFRDVFKARVRIGPSAWRQTLRPAGGR
jgi:AraC-like DNA-binding protein